MKKQKIERKTKKESPVTPTTDREIVKSQIEKNTKSRLKCPNTSEEEKKTNLRMRQKTPESGFFVFGPSPFLSSL